MKEQRQATAAVPFPEELEHLELVKGKIEGALQQAEASVRRHQRDYSDFMDYMARHHGEIDPKEIFQSQQLLEQEGFVGLLALKQRDNLSRLLGSPYFGRIDFTTDDAGHGGVFYVGRTAFRDDEALYVLDWRAPVASMFYDFELGPVHYETPKGPVKGNMHRKRQFKIARGQMEYAIEASLAIRDDVLQKELSSNSSEKMRSIIATIQKEQNLIIRDEKAKVMLIQGVAGSGKTSIALHRIAYLLYRFKDTLTASNVVILSPNKVFSDHISNVLPELGEQPVYQMGFVQLAHAQLEGIQGFYPEPDPLESTDAALARRSRHKGTAAFLRQMDAYIAHVVATVFVPQDYAFGPLVAPKQWIWERYQAYARYPVKRRIREIAEDIRDRFISRNIQQHPIPAMREVLKALNAMLAVRTTRELYKQMYRWMGVPQYLKMQKSSVEWADAYPFLYLHAAFEGLRENHRIRHVVVDEMQDYTPVQFSVLKKLFDCKMTILGDFSQTVDPNKSHKLEDLCTLFPGATLMRLQKSYRSTWEIIAFAGKIRPDLQLEAVQRHGDVPRVLACKTMEEQLLQLKGLIRAFEAGEGTSLGILLKHQQEAEWFYGQLGESERLHLIGPDSESFSAGVSVLSIGMSKGLEFDAVIIPQVDAEHYATQHDRNLLYVACTRAMHQLALLHTGGKSPLLP